MHVNTVEIELLLRDRLISQIATAKKDSLKSLSDSWQLKWKHIIAKH